MIEIRNLKKSFEGKLIFEEISLEIPEGQFIGIYGPSGIGKSTLAKVLCGVLTPDEGTVHFDGELLTSPKTKYNRQKGLGIQMVYQQPYSSLDGSQRILAGFRELIRYHKFAKTRAEADVLIDSLMAEVGLQREILNHLPHQISGGEAQRIAIARCLLFKPKLLILDEATSMLDVSTQANVLGLVKRVMAKHNGSVLLISHDRELVEHLCGKIYVFDNTKLKLEK